MPPRLIRLDPDAEVVPVDPPVRVVAARETVTQSRTDMTKEGAGRDEKKDDILIRYRVQVAIASLHLTREELEERIGCELSNGMTVLRAGNLYKYQSGSFEKYTEAALYLAELKDGGVTDAFIVAYRNDEQIPVEQARSQEKSPGR
jgi:hypothetical protein